MPRRVQGPDGVIHEFPDDATDAEISAALSGGASAPAAKPQGVRAEGSTFREKVQNAASMLSNALPSAGGIIGGIYGGAPGAALGGAAGEGYRQLAQHASELPGAVVDVVRGLVSHPAETARGFVSGATQGAVKAGAEGAAQGVGQAVGDAAVKYGVLPMSKWLMNRATSRVSMKLMQDFPELNDTLIDNALTVSKGGYARARELLLAAKSKATAALKLADQSGATVPVQLTDDLAQSLKTALLEDAVKGKRIVAQAGQPLTAASERLDPATQAVFQKVDAALQAGKPLDLTPSQADLLKTQLQRESRALYANRSAPNGPKAMGMDATERGEFATQLNNAIDQIATGYKQANAEAKPLIGAVRGIKQAIRPNGNLYQAMFRPVVGAVTGGAIGSREGGPGSIVGAIAGAAATSPAGMSREAILLAHPAVQGAIRALPMPLAQALIDALGGSSDTPPAPGGGQP